MTDRKLIPKKPGIYVLVLFLEKDKNLKIGSLGRIPFERGLYGYVGSARGPGGLRGRVSRHLSVETKVFWHIDYLLQDEDVEVTKVGFIVTKKDLECTLGEKLVKQGAQPTVQGFGSSDCTCETHLFRVKGVPLQSVQIHGKSLRVIELDKEHEKRI
ncbi:MAG: GIY-YIG nuclease family protein [Candidatus Korarchaeota archaeon]|nr:GIY-YIG nuclease family protein [Candidatus Korarchaeota archaeon]NIU83940.1 DUF123 domain-containing protein [Candidatus Thorarchaeota archaeon]NIW14068.1 DUF123 domain-containing protein [Candidatus Thorarchaeota archaeon]NIW52178.1 DUF123 domain-containing protein [Candidatus Korarchaeota archaeon]